MDLVKYSLSKDSTTIYKVTTESAKLANSKEKKAKDPCTTEEQMDLEKYSLSKDSTTTHNVTTKSAKSENSKGKNAKNLCTTEEQKQGHSSDMDSTISYEIKEM